ncbi:methylated-DNA--[protein]-cysteine S-methyltransferase [Nonomuraea glycinis]|uniref:Methylated-DNA:protein-cysteine methyltransferase n=1 Tax=Nonomuraea glycinis TaxID=2047744 RepID=A0A918AEJ8_9ACTN|nr:methylated-DNA--[protein]-cysteine S-methyltransferase [Nonomuraea glycinis]MCA2182949.1 methylated-DNA--[protein]-cysteine S-methyltransferase [Nonomuraea glycinis]GGP17478.1 putative methylated-DNA:protein-cysteine methyltransferase [Nonomuraea glycinis]
MINAQILPTPIGELSVLTRDEVLVAAGFTADPKEMYVRLSPALQAEGLDVVDDLGPVAQAVRAYFDGDLEALDAIAVEQPGTPTRKRLHQVLREVRPGTTVSYAELAVRAGLPRTAARAAGSACAQNLIAPFVPCHRVLPTTGGFGGYYYGVPVKEWLLAHESSKH